MATLIPALGSCTARMTAGERRLAQRLEDKLDEDYLLWYDVPVGPQSSSRASKTETASMCSRATAGLISNISVFFLFFRFIPKSFEKQILGLFL